MKKGYKQTEVGLIPEDWEVVKIEDFTYCTTGGTPSTYIDHYWNGNIPWLNSGELNKCKIYNSENFISAEGLKNSASKLIPENCVLIGLAGQGKTRGTVALNKFETSINQSIGAIFPNNNFNYYYLYYNLQKRYIELRTLSTGDGGRGGLNLSIIRNLFIPFPPLKEQQAIASALTDADAWIESLEKLLQKKRLIKQGAMQELLKPKEGWDEKRLDDICELINGRAYKQTELLTKGKYRVLRVGNLFTNDSWYWSDLELSFDKYIENGDLIYAWSASFGPQLWVGDRTIYHYHIWKVTNFKGCNKEYLFHAFEFDKNTMLKEAQGGTMFHLTKFEMEKRIFFLPRLPEQTRIATILSDMDAEIDSLEQKLIKARQIKQGMMQQLLTGSIRLINTKTFQPSSLQPETA